LVFVLFCVAMASKGRIHFKDMTAVFFLVILIAYGLSYIVKLRDYGSTLSDKRVLLAYGLGLSWLGDSAAYTFGKAFGRRKLSPRISPNKTIFGAVSGVAIVMVVSVILFAIYSANCDEASLFYMMNNLSNYFIMALVGFVGGIIGVIGDLSLSFVKRESGLKDFSNIMPGHGGAIDRIDNILFTSTYAYFVFTILLK